MPQDEYGSRTGTSRQKATARVKAAVEGTVAQARRARAQLGETIKEGGELLHQTRAAAGTAGRSAARGVREVMERTAHEARRAGEKLGHSLKESGEYLRLRHAGNAIRMEMDEHFRAIGKRAFALSKRARGENPFARFRQIVEEVETLERLEKRFQDVRTRLSTVRLDLRGKKR
jgi:hypothetical protein